jgi:hypothetical protein
MQGAALSPPELFFFNQHAQAVNNIASDLADLYRRPPTIYQNLATAENSIISRLLNIFSVVQDIETDLRALSQQTFDLTRRNLPAVLVEFEGEPIPVLFSVADRSRFTGALNSANLNLNQPNVFYSLADPLQAMRDVAAPLTKFLASRSTQSVPTTTTPMTPNVTVSNTAHGWQIVYSPYYVQSENGFGGPSTPVNGYLSPGRYRFGIKGSTPAQWDGTSWRIPAQNNVYVPLP